ETDMTDHLTFECPHCKQPVDVKEERLGGNVDCPHCDHTFQASAPMGRLMSAGLNNGGKTATAGEAEKTLRIVRPVLFRRHLVMSAVTLMLLIAAAAGLALWLMGRALFGLEGTVLLTISLVAGLIAVAYAASRGLNR